MEGIMPVGELEGFGADAESRREACHPGALFGTHLRSALIVQAGANPERLGGDQLRAEHYVAKHILPEPARIVIIFRIIIIGQVRLLKML